MMSSAPTAPTSSQLLLTSIQNYGERPAVTVSRRCFSYRELDEMSDRLAQFLADQGVGRGVAVALHLRNGIEYVIAEVAILKLSAIRVPLNELMSSSELSYCLAHSGAQILITHADLPKAEYEVARPLEIIVGDEKAELDPDQVGWANAMASAPLTSRVAADPDDTAIIAYTGGTTGKPKGVRHTYGRMAWNLFSHVNSLDIRSDEVMLLTTPLPHSAGYHMIAAFLQGAHVVIEKRFEPRRFFVLCRELNVTWTMMVPTMLYRLLDDPRSGGEDHRSLRTIVYGAAPISRPRLEEALSKFGQVFIQLYGQTECPNLITTLSKEDHSNAALLASCGRPVPMVQLRLSAQEDGSGEVEVCSPYLLTEYYRDPAATATALQDGWLRTGDLARLDQGYLFLVDRAKDMIISGGMNVYSTEVEVVLREHPDVLDASVVGVPHSDWGEAVTAVVIASPDADKESIRQFAKSRLSAYKVPKNIILAEAFPLTNYGKIDKRRLREIAVALVDQA